jgi:DNA-binding winged helix-turn-helix (wHTH) protein/tetratricopeptide (TPR) repeat protein
MKPEGIFRFGEFQIDALARTLRREKELVTLNRRAFDVLLYLAQNPGRLVTREELLRNAWPDTFVDENSLAQSISALRRALEEKPGDNNYVVTLPGRGYQFVAPVQALVPDGLANIRDGTTSANNLSSAVIVQQQTVRTTVVTEEQASVGSAALPGTGAARVPKLWKIAAPIVLVGLLVAGGLYYRSHQKQRLTEKDTIVLTDFANSTGDAVFDDTLKTALTISLRQSPFLNILPDSQVAKTLQLMTHPAGTKLTPELARDLCRRVGSKAYISGAIGSLGSEYMLGLKAVNCASGDTLADERVTAASKDKVLGVLGKAASKLRGELGESLATVQRFDIPLPEITTPSLEALKAFSLARKSENGNPTANLAYDQRAIELDPNFAMGYRAVGLDYARLGQPDRTSEYVTKAFQLREHASDREKLAITANYYHNVTRELDKAALAYEEWIESYPRQSGMAYGNLTLAYANQGQYEKAAEIARQGRRLEESRALWNENLANYTLALQSFGETRQILDDTRARSGDDLILHSATYALAFVGSDSTGMEDQQKWFASKPEYANLGLQLESDTEAYRGHAAKARKLTRQAVDSALRTDAKELGAVELASAGQWEAVYGNSAEARQAAAEALKLAPASQGAEIESALVFALAGDPERSESLAEDLDKRFPLGTQMQAIWLPAIRAQVALDQKNPSSALNILRNASPIEFGNIPFTDNISCLDSIYVRGEAYLAAGQGTAAAAEFQKILDHNGIVWNCWTGALAHLGVARANALQSRAAQGAEADAARVRALAAYKDFLSLWKDADPNLLLLKQAKAEYAKLNSPAR